ncbi:MAG: hypothetical protein V3U72_05185 [Candidatus Aenigmarchaeota archaeon]
MAKKKAGKKLRRGKKPKSAKRAFHGKGVKKKVVGPFIEKTNTKVKERIETDIDKLYELIKDRGILKVKVASRKFRIDAEQVEEWGRILEQHKLIKLHYPPIGDPVLILKKFKSDMEEIKKLKQRKMLRPDKRVFLINIAILLGFIVFVSFFTVRIPAIRISYVQLYLAVIVIIIIGMALILKFKKAEMISLINKIKRRGE